MKHNLDTYSDKDPLDILPGMPSGPDTIDTSAMRSILPALIVRVYMMLKPEGIERGALSRLWYVRSMLAYVYKTEIYNIKLWFLNAMQSDRDWQRQVREDLGGEAALARWDKRYAKMMAGDAPKDTAKKTLVRDKTRRTNRKVKTDRFSVFRLAAVTKDTPRKASYRAPRYACSYRSAAIRLGRFGTIPLTPDQLRAPAAPSLQPGGATDNAPKPSLEAILDARTIIRSRFEMFNLNISYLDIEISFPDKKRDPIPI